MKRIKLIALSVGVALAALSAHAQTFQDLDFESATLSPVPPNYGPTVYVPVSSALPGWTAYLGADLQTQVIQNSYGFGQAEVDIFGPNYPAAGYPPSVYNPGTIDGNYSVLLQSGGEPQNSDVTVSASIAQYGTVPVDSQSLQFKAWTYGPAQFSVSFDGSSLPPVVLGSGANYTLYGVDISSYDGQTGTLQFTAPFYSWLGLDDITFSVPEPSIVALTAIGGLLFGARKWFARH